MARHGRPWPATAAAAVLLVVSCVAAAAPLQQHESARISVSGTRAARPPALFPFLLLLGFEFARGRRRAREGRFRFASPAASKLQCRRRRLVWTELAALCWLAAPCEAACDCDPRARQLTLRF